MGRPARSAERSLTGSPIGQRKHARLQGALSPPAATPTARDRDSFAPGRASTDQTGAGGVFLGVPSVPSSVALLTALRARLGPDIQLLAPEVFDPETALLAGTAADGLTITQPGRSADDVPADGDEFVSAYPAPFGEKPTRYALAAAQATDVLLDAVAASDGTRASATRSLFNTRVSNGILGSFFITPTGDTTLNAVTVHRIVDGEVTTIDGRRSRRSRGRRVMVTRRNVRSVRFVQLGAGSGANQSYLMFRWRKLFSGSLAA